LTSNYICQIKKNKCGVSATDIGIIQGGLISLWQPIDSMSSKTHRGRSEEVKETRSGEPWTRDALRAAGDGYTCWRHRFLLDLNGRVTYCLVTI